MLKYASDIMKSVESADRRLGRSSRKPGKVPLVLLGGAAIMLGHKGQRWTMDIDAIYTQGLRGLGDVMQELHIVTDAIAYLHPDYMERVVPLRSLENIDLFLLSPVDIAISKTARGYAKDFKDIYDSTVTDSINADEFEALYTEGMDYWIGGTREGFLRNMEETKAIIREKHLLNDTGILDIISEELERICTSGEVSGTVETDAIRYVISGPDEREKLRKKAGVRDSMEYLLLYAGEALTDTRGEITLINLLRKHYERSNPAPLQARAAAGPDVNPARLFKLFKTLAQLVMSRLQGDKIDQLEDRFPSQ